MCATIRQIPIEPKANTFAGVVPWIGSNKKETIGIANAQMAKYRLRILTAEIFIATSSGAHL